MKQSIKRLLSATVAATMTLSLSATAFADDVGAINENPRDSFYQTYGYERAADVFYNGKYMNFPLAYPLVQNGTTYVPLAYFAETIGADVEYFAETHSVELTYKGDKIFFDIGSSDYSVNDGAIQQLPYPTFAAANSTMVPVRFITDVFGYGLYWNGTEKQVIIVDIENLKAGIDTDYTIFTELMQFANGSVEGGQLLTGSFTYEIESDGIVVTTVSEVNIHADNDAGINAQMDLAVDFGDHADLLLEELQGHEDSALAEALLQALGAFNLDMICDINTMDLYFQSDIIPTLIPFMLGTTANDLGVDGETWYKISLFDLMSEQDKIIFEAAFSDALILENDLTMENLVDYILEQSRENDNDYNDFYALAKGILDFAHNDNFVKNGANYVYADSQEVGGSPMTWNLTIHTENDKVISYICEFGMYDDYTTLDCSIAQASQNEITFIINASIFDDLFYEMTGDFEMELTDAPVVLVPDSNDILNLTPYLQ
ncbi:MAG: copper amine oxidase N-terminal domain-containing protein [Eubacteriales bacterium]